MAWVFRKVIIKIKIPKESIKQPLVKDSIHDIIDQVKNCARTVYKELGGGYLEEVYGEAMAIELRERKIPYEIERNREIFYKGFKVGTHRLDFIVKGTLVVELKATTSITKSHIGQTYG